ncbi:hypothetical protein NIES22_67850 (plasmid) [Calothrix brevissima NIES-22]|nr:hypothetical protein NIES22_67850 [Calothrix brevissima NIES-22]
MPKELIIQDFIIIIAAKNHSPSILNPEFLKYSGIVPKEWNLARAPISTSSFARLDFSNGISIIAEPNRIMFMESIADNQISSLQIPEIARKYVQALPHMEFEAVGINPRGYVPFAGGGDAAWQYLSETLLSPGAWQSDSEAAMRASLNLVYKFKRAPLYLNITEAALRQEDETSTPIVMFSGSFSYELTGETAEKLTTLHQAIDNWLQDLSTYSDIINHKFLANTASSTQIVHKDAAETDLFAMSATA